MNEERTMFVGIVVDVEVVVSTTRNRYSRFWCVEYLLHLLHKYILITRRRGKRGFPRYSPYTYAVLIMILALQND